MSQSPTTEGVPLPPSWARPRAAAAEDPQRPFRDLLNALPAAVYTTDAEGWITSFNEAAAAFAGRRPVIGQDRWCVTWKLFRPDGTPMPHDECPMAVALKEQREPRAVEAVAVRPDGARVAFTPHPTLLRGPSGEVVGAVNMLVDITERKAAEQRQRLLANEVNHRANNLLTVVQATLRLTQADTAAELKAALTGRIQALAHAHGLLARSHWVGADLQSLISAELAPFIGGERPRVWMSGTPLALNAPASQSLAMVIHELAANAIRHGALSVEEGRVMLEWRTTGGRLEFRWTEHDGPPVSGPPRKGVGATVIDRAAASLRGAVITDWRAEGLSLSLTAPLAEIERSDTDVRISTEDAGARGNQGRA